MVLNETFWRQRLHQVAEQRVKQRSKDHLCCHHQRNDNWNNEGSQNIGLPAVQPPDMAASPDKVLINSAIMETFGGTMLKIVVPAYYVLF
jgi:hypothetical protein